MKNCIYSCLVLFGLFSISCKDLSTSQTDGLSNTMSVNVNGIAYDLTNVVGGGADGYGGGPFCRGTLNGNNLYIYMKFNDTVSIGSTFNNGLYTYVYTVNYDSSKTIENSGVITCEYSSSGRVKGTFSAIAVNKSDTLKFQNGAYSVYLKTAE